MVRVMAEGHSSSDNSLGGQKKPAGETWETEEGLLGERQDSEELECDLEWFRDGVPGVTISLLRP